jgi:FixJ family two-component response regulator
MPTILVSSEYSRNHAQVIRCGFRPSRSPEAAPIVFVLDRDASVRESLELAICREGWQAKTFSTAREFLNHPRAVVANCLVLDASLPGVDALDLQKRLAADRPEMPIIFVAVRPDVPTTVKAMKAGAMEFLTKPVCEDLLVISIREALERSRTALGREAEMRPLRECYGALSRREREVMSLVVAGLLNKQVGGELGISEITVKAHRGQVMQKMKANSLADLVKMATRLNLGSASIA